MSIFMGSTKSWNTGWTHGRSPERALKNKLSLHNTTNNNKITPPPSSKKRVYCIVNAPSSAAPLELSELPLYSDVYILPHVLSPPSFLAFLYHWWPVPALLSKPCVGGDGQRLLCTFWIKLKYSCMCACVSVWARLHVYPFLVRVYICESLGWSGTVRKEFCMLGCILLHAAMHVQHFVLFLSLSFFARWCTQPCRLTRLPK